MKQITSKFTVLGFVGVALGALVFLGSCSKSSSGTTTPPVQLIGGYASSDSVASANLIAYWPFNGDANDHKGGLTGTATGSVTYSASGVRGQAYQGAIGAYEIYSVPGGSPFASLPSYSYSVWYKMAAQDTLPQGMFFLTGTTTQDLLINEIEPFTPKGLDSVRIHTGFNDLASPAYQLFVPESFDTMAINKWVHWVVTYNGGTSTYTVYQDALPIGTNSAFSSGKYITPNMMWTDGTMTTPLGNLGFTSDPPKTVVIGSWPDGLFGQVAAKDCFLGQMDEVRIFNKALTQTEVSGLFLNGQAGR
jgi:hypothetical protein